MKKLLVLILCLTLLLCACTSSGGQEDDQSTTEAPKTEATQPEETEATEPPATEATDAATEGHSEEDPFDLAQSCVGETVEKLYELIGQPDASDYAPSCLGPGEDGNLYYDSYGFTVYTYKEDGVETVRIVE